MTKYDLTLEYNITYRKEDGSTITVVVIHTKNPKGNSIFSFTIHEYNPNGEEDANNTTDKNTTEFGQEVKDPFVVVNVTDQDNYENATTTTTNTTTNETTTVPYVPTEKEKL